MKFLLFSILIFCAVKCDDGSNNYYVVEVVEDEISRDFRKPFRVYWNVPTIQCKSKKILFDNLYEKYGIIQNDEDSFNGEKITIMYEPGLFPAIFKNETSGKYRFRNGGVPQEGNLEEHLKAFRADMEEIVPNPDFSGIGIIDFESWRPIFRQNFGTLVPYKDVSCEIEKKLHWWWPKSWINAEAKQRFEASARTFMQTTISIAKQMRPKALWGYYGFPHCFNMAGQNSKEDCAPNVLAENDITYWMWSESTALYPSVYSSRNLSSDQLGSLVRGRVREANRVRRYETPILPYYWFRYREGGYMTEEDLNVVLKSFYKSNASGFIIWGSSNDVNTVSKCNNLYSYVEKVLGPTVAKYIKKINIANDVMIETPPELNFVNDTVTSDINMTNKTSAVESTETSTNSFIRKGEIDPDYDWVPPVNYSQDISQNVEEELQKKGFNKTEDITDIKTLNDSLVVDMIFDALIKGDNYNESSSSKQTTRNIVDETVSNNNNSLEVTEAPIIKDTDSLNSLITKDPLGFIEHLAIEEEKIEHFDETINIDEYKDEDEDIRLKDSSIGNILPLDDNQKPILTPATDVIVDIVSDTTTSISDTTSKDSFNVEDNNVKSKNENVLINIIDFLLNGNSNIENENDKQYIKRKHNKMKNLTSDFDSTVKKLSNNDNSEDLDTNFSNESITINDEFVNNSTESYTEISTTNEEVPRETTFEIDHTTEVDLPYDKENNQSTHFSTTEESNEDLISFNEEFDDFLVENITDLNYETSTQYDTNTETFNLSSSTDTILSTDKNINTNVYTAEDSNTSESVTVTERGDNEFITLGNNESVTVTESGDNEFSTIDNKVEVIYEDKNESSFTTDAASDQVVTYIYYP
ncbi:hyaluronidase PH-20-like isoform X2 [Vanessa cardui]|uniref:hyaluronidase PH-20-like isoform X2 n=1 Tax=Vanessa cardui TaxID=171605 RepID=UPI001F135631|nr:hyaluronidase PH-20-like isoform X2 [Vanessa cardui]